MEEAIKFVMQFYQIAQEDAVKYYWDEVESYMRLKTQFEDESE